MPPPTSPFLLSPRTTSILTTHLPSHTPSKTVLLCPSHTLCAATAQKTYHLHHAALRALLSPVSDLLHRALDLASTVLASEHHANDLERAFLGPARDAVLWYTSLAHEELDWIAAVCGDPPRLATSSLRCPACLVDGVLQSQSTIRIVLAACRVARVDRHGQASSPRDELPGNPLDPLSDHGSPKHGSSSGNDGSSSFQPADDPLLQVARRWARAVEAAVVADTFWTPCDTAAAVHGTPTLCASERARARRLAAALLLLEEQVDQLDAMLTDFQAAQAHMHRAEAGAHADADADAHQQVELLEEDEDDKLSGAACRASREAEKREQTRRVVDAFVRAWVAGGGGAGGATRCGSEAGSGRRYGADAAAAGGRLRGAGRLRSVTG